MADYEELLKAKELLDSGVLDEAEYNAIKKKLLGLDTNVATAAPVEKAKEPVVEPELAPIPAVEPVVEVESSPVVETTEIAAEPIKEEKSAQLVEFDVPQAAPATPVENVANPSVAPVFAVAPEDEEAKKKAKKKKFLIIGGAVAGLIVLAVVLVIALGGGNSSNDPIVGEWTADYVFANGNGTRLYSDSIELEVTGRRWTLDKNGEETSGTWKLDSTGNLSDGSEYRLYRFNSGGTYKLISYYASNDVLMINPAQSVDASNFTSFTRDY